MIRVTVFFVGKERGGWIQEGVKEYGRRLQGKIFLNWIACGSDAQLVAQIEKERQVVGLDPAGRGLDSIAFSQFLYDQLEAGGSRLAVVIGGPDGLPAQLRESLPLISLSPLTFTHELARVVLAEQIYRAMEIRKGSCYHK